MSRKKRDPLDSPFAVGDIEALDWNNYRTGCFVTSEGDAVRCDTPEQLGAETERFQGRVFFHYGGRYDFFFLPEPSQVTLSGSGILRAQLGQASLYDSWFLFQMSLKKLGKAVGHAKHDGKSDRIEELTLEETAEHCRNDCEVLRVALLKHRAWCRELGHAEPRWPATAGGTAVYGLETFEADGVAQLARERVDLTDWLHQYASVTGGRVELWQLGHVPGPIYSYDIRSSYPRSWLDGPLPLGPWVRVQCEVLGAAVYRCEVEQSRSTLPVVAPLHQWRYDGEAWLTHEEVAAVRAHGGTVRVLDGWSSLSEPQWFGSTFAQRMYAAKAAGDPWAKVSINSAHGKFGQGIMQTAWVKRHGVWNADTELGFPSWHQRPLVGAYVLSRARLRLHAMLHALKAAGWRCLYVDTDCVHTDCPPDKFPGELGAELGQWAHEATASEAVYVAPKVYMLRLAEGTYKPDDGPFKLAAKGLPREQVTWELMMQAASGKPVGFRTDKGLVGFRRLAGTWEARRSMQVRQLTTQTGGKYVIESRNRQRRLAYPDHLE